MKLFPVFGSPGHPLNIGRRVASHFPYGHLFALKRHKSSCMLNNHLQLFFRRYYRNFLSGQSRAQLCKQPGVPIGASRQHQSVTISSLAHAQTVLQGKNVPIAKYRDLHCLFYLAYDFPVSFSHIKLIPGPAMNSHRRNARVLSNPCNFHRVPMFFVPPGTKLNRYRNPNRFDHGFQYFTRQFRGLH